MVGLKPKEVKQLAQAGGAISCSPEAEAVFLSTILCYFCVHAFIDSFIASERLICWKARAYLYASSAPR